VTDPEFEVGATSRKLAECQKQLLEIEEWVRRGERLASLRGWGALFRLGKWFGERPWRRGGGEGE